MPLLRKVIQLVATFGLVFLAPSAGLPAYQISSQKGPGNSPGEFFGWEQKTSLNLTFNCTVKRFSQPGEKELLAKAQTTSKPKG